MFESFYGANLQFYFYFALLWGLFIFIWRKDINVFDKTLVLSPIALQLLTITFFLFGTYRYRAPITPFNLIILASAAEAFFSSSPRTFGAKIKKAPHSGVFSLPINFYKWLGKPITYSLIAAFAAALIFAGYNMREPRPTGSKAKSTLTPWTGIHKTEKKLVNTYDIEFNSTVLAFYQLLEEETSAHDLFISFDICRFLMPGMKPYYRLALDGRLIGEPKEIPSGCSIATVKFQPEFEKGMLSLFTYISTEGKTSGLKPYDLKISDTQSIQIPFFSSFSLTKEQKDYSDLFNRFSYGHIRAGKPVLIKKPK